VAATGDIVIGDTTVTFTVAVLPLPVEVAVIVHAVGYSPARNSPVDEMFPHEAAHVALALAVNCCVAFSLMVCVALGEIVNVFGPMVSIAVAAYAVPLAAVAVIEQTAPGAPDAVNNPALDIDPHDADQVTAALAVNCWVEYWLVVALAGVIIMGVLTVTAAEAALPPAVGFAVTAHVPATSGAVYNPAGVTDPQLADHVALALAVNCCVDPALSEALVGETVSAAVGERIWS
jgi:hypothetical protein